MNPQKEIKPHLILQQFFRSLYINNLFFYVLSGNVVLFILSFVYPNIFLLSKLLLFGTFFVLFIDIITLYLANKGLSAERILPEKFSNGDENSVFIKITNHFNILIHSHIIDELPYQFQNRDFHINNTLKPKQQNKITYSLKPVKRGEYYFGNLNIYAKTTIGFASRRFIFEKPRTVKTYPGFLQLKKYDLLSIKNIAYHQGIKKIRRVGHSFEFEKIKEYVQGDNIRDINWKATAKKNQLMVNQYQDEQAQSVYSIIDKGRVMKMPFNSLSLLDYAINASLIISNVVIKKHDKAGIFSFSNKTENFVVAERRNSQMNLILESLYNIDTDYKESDFSNLYASIKRHITHRSLLLLYTNFESLDAVHRQMNYLRAINKNHLLVVIFFQNTELENLTKLPANTTQEIFDKVIAEKFSYDKKLIISELNNLGIQTILTTPQNLTIDTINRYLEIKAKGML